MTPAAAIVLAVLLQFAPLMATVDPRIRIVAYDEGRVVTVQAAQGYATLIELSPEERVENVVVGDASAWQVIANKQGDRVAVKPLAGAAPTNMMILTDARRYVFQLDPGGDAQVTPFVLRFSYQPLPTTFASDQPPAAAGVYRLSGAKTLRPHAMSDDGKRTSIQWDANAPMPAIFAVDRRGKEALVNGRMAGDRFVVEGVSPRYVFRLGGRRAAARRVAAGGAR